MGRLRSRNCWSYNTIAFCSVNLSAQFPQPTPATYVCMHAAVICNNSDIQDPGEQCAAGDNESKQDMTCVWRELPIPYDLRSLSPPSTQPPKRWKRYIYSPPPLYQHNPLLTLHPRHLPHPPTPLFYCHANPVTTLLISLSCHSSNI